MKNTGKEYEQLTKLVFEQIINQTTTTTIKVDHDVIIKGKTTSHQIDVYWEFSLAGITYRAIIQAKDWASNVPQVEMLAFKAILDDLPSGTKGIYVTKTGYQSGALDVAKSNGISTYILKKPNTEDWKGRIREIHTEFHCKIAQNNDIKIAVDEQWIDDNNASIKDGLNRFYDPNIIIYNDIEGYEIQLQKLFIKYCDQVGEGVKFVKEDFEDAYLGSSCLDKIKIKSISGNFGYHTTVEDVVVRLEDIVGYILIDLLNESGDRTTFDKNANLLNSTV